MANRRNRRTFLKESVFGVTGIAIGSRLQASVFPDAGWATLRGQIIYDGTPPVPKRIRVTKDEDICGKYDLIDESLVVNPKSRGVKDVIVSLKLGRGDTVSVHDSYGKDEEGDVFLDNKCCRFAPHVTVLRTTQTLVIRNLDPKGDTVMIDSSRNRPINVTLTHNQTHRQEYPNAERMPLRVSCGIHPWELGWLVVADHPYVAVTDKDGKFEIKNIPAGKVDFMFWQEKAGYVSDVVLHGQPESWSRGTRQFDLTPGDHDLGQIIVKPELFKD